MPQDSAAQRAPQGELAIRTLAMPADTNPAGDIFGGWVLSQMDVAGGLIARVETGGRVATVAVDSMTFHLPVFVGDAICCYGAVKRIGRTSIAIHVETWALRGGAGERVLVTEGLFTYVAIDDARRPRVIGSG
ncbi:MAG: acyl-CoA thioesterase [Marivibrio sp.]|uniref:acyl-CoA thioesterase n=1 Tax=Marivibrio sp. TaxID=2039719 RepID=UPI0032ECDE7D